MMKPQLKIRETRNYLSDDRPHSLPQFRSHSRDWRQNFYVYPVLSRRSQGLSIGINLNPDAACNFDCVYCQVDRTQDPRTRQVDIAVLSSELEAMLKQVASGAGSGSKTGAKSGSEPGMLFDEPEFAEIPPSLRRLNDIAFSGDGEPTTCPQFLECVSLTAELKGKFDLGDVKIVLITDACYLTKPNVEKALVVLDENQGEIWAKLDAGTQAYYERVNRPNYPLSHVIENITAAARVRPLVIQSLFMRLDGAGPDEVEIIAYTDRLNEIIHAGGAIKLVQAYTIARRPVESFATPLNSDELDNIVEVITQRTNLPVSPFYAC